MPEDIIGKYQMDIPPRRGNGLNTPTLRKEKASFQDLKTLASFNH